MSAPHHCGQHLTKFLKLPGCKVTNASTSDLLLQSCCTSPAHGMMLMSSALVLDALMPCTALCAQDIVDQLEMELLSKPSLQEKADKAVAQVMDLSAQLTAARTEVGACLG